MASSRAGPRPVVSAPYTRLRALRRSRSPRARATCSPGVPGSRSIKPDGGGIEAEVYLFGRFADDGRLVQVVETARMLRGSEADADLASAR